MAVARAGVHNAAGLRECGREADAEEVDRVAAAELEVVEGGGQPATTHGSLHPYDQHVPLVFLGAAFVPGRYQTPVSPADAAATLAATVGLSIAGVEGRPITARAPPNARPK